MSITITPPDDTYKKVMETLWKGKASDLKKLLDPLPKEVKTWFLITLVGQSSILEEAREVIPGLIPPDLEMRFSNVRQTIAAIVPDLCGATSSKV